jgi:cytochrome c(L)
MVLRSRPSTLFWSALLVAAGLLAPARAQTVPANRDQVARPGIGGMLPGNPKVALVKVAEGFHDPTNIAAAHDGSGRLFVVERVGRVRVVDKTGAVAPEPFLDLTKINPLGTDVQTGFVEQGLYSLAFHPRFRENGYFYVHYASLPFNGDGVIVRFQVDPASANVMTAERTNSTAKVLLRIPQPYYNHNGGQIEFGPDGYLYIGSGDGGWEGDPLEAGQDLSLLLGKMLRIDVDTAEDRIPYLIPPTNPFAGAADERLMQLFGISEADFAKIKTRARPEIWQFGLRNPYEFAFDAKTGALFIADVGQNHWEEIHWSPPGSKGGENLGWNRMEGSRAHPVAGATDDGPVVGMLPVAEYPHEVPYPGAAPLRAGHGCSVQGLGVANYGGMNGVYLVGDWCSGRLFGVGWDGQKWVIDELLHSNLQFTAGGVGEDGFVYAVNCNCFYTADRGPTGNPPGGLWRIVPAADVKPGMEMALTVQQVAQMTAPAEGTPVFLHAMTNAPLKMDLYPNETVSAKAIEFLRTGKNPYAGDKEATAAGRALYDQWCAACHLADGTGRIGSSLVDAQVTYPRVVGDVGMFEVIYGGGTGAMQPFGTRLTKDEILRTMAFLASLPKK